MWFSIRRIVSQLLLVALCCSTLTFSSSVRSQETEKERADGPLVETTVVYDMEMLVCVSADVVAAVRFHKPFDLGNQTGNGVVGVSYDWRLVATDRLDDEELTGSGKVFTKFEEGKPVRGDSAVKCGPLELQWSTKDAKSGLIAYNANDVVVHSVTSSRFGKPPRIDFRVNEEPALDLTSFVRPDLDLIKIKQSGVRGADRKSHPGDIAGMIAYRGSITLIKDPFGLALVEFKETFKRKAGPEQEQTGVSYSYTLFPRDGSQAQTGEGEIYEQYTKGVYDSDGGRLFIEAGPIHLLWSQGGPESGWIYYHPTWTRVWTVHSSSKDLLMESVQKGVELPLRTNL